MDRTGKNAPASSNRASQAIENSQSEDEHDQVMEMSKSTGGILGDSALAEHLVTDKERNFMQSHRFMEETFQEGEMRAMRLLNGLHIQKASNKHLQDILESRARDLRQKMQEGTYRERTLRHTVETKLEQTMNKYEDDVRSKVAEDELQRQEADLYKKDVQAEICHLYNSTNQATDFRIAQGNHLANVVQAKLAEIRLAADAEHRIRKDSENTLLTLFGQMGDKISQEFELSKRERIATGDRLTVLLETASKLLQNTKSAEAGGLRLEEGCDAKTMQSNAIRDSQIKRRLSAKLDRSRVDM